MSTLSVYSDQEGRSLEEAKDEASFPEWPVPLPEDWPTVPPGDDGYSARKAAVEQALRERAPWPVTIVRPGAIHGPYSHHLRGGTSSKEPSTAGAKSCCRSTGRASSSPRRR